MARQGQLEFIEDLLAKHGLTRERLGEEEPEWEQYEKLPDREASELLDWLLDYPRSARSAR